MSRVRSGNRLDRSNYEASLLWEAALGDVRVAAASIARFSVGADAGLEMWGPPFFFLVLDGTCWIEGGKVPLQPGDAVLAMRGDLLKIASDPGTTEFREIAHIWRENGAPPVSWEGYHRPVDIHWGDKPPLCHMVGAAMVLSRSDGLAKLIDAMPRHICLSAGKSRLGAWTPALRSMLEHESAEPCGGFAVLGQALAQGLLVQILRVWLAAEGAGVVEAGTGVVERVRKTMILLQQSPMEDWTVADLARHAGMSRTTFLDQFGRIAGTTPRQYLIASRMDLAARLLRDRELSVAETARRCGYQSERAFRNNFSRCFGINPLEFRARGAVGRSKDEGGGP